MNGRAYFSRKGGWIWGKRVWWGSSNLGVPRADRVLREKLVCLQEGLEPEGRPPFSGLPSSGPGTSAISDFQTWLGASVTGAEGVGRTRLWALRPSLGPSVSLLICWTC